VWFEVYQCLLHKPGIARNQITQIASHPQALKQCERYLKQEYPRATLLEWSDTAQAAKDLAEGTLPEYTAVIAPSRSAQIYGLEFLDRGIQDAHPNLTTFIIVQPKQQT
jgi:prephenate dehydratase